MALVADRDDTDSSSGVKIPGAHAEAETTSPSSFFQSVVGTSGNTLEVGIFDPPTSVQRPRITVGSAPHLKGYTPRKQYMGFMDDGDAQMGGREESRFRTTREERPYVEEEEYVSSNGVIKEHRLISYVVGSDNTDRGIGSIASRSTSPVSATVEEVLVAPSTETRGEHGETTMAEAQGPATVLDYYLGTGPQVAMMVLHPDVARAMDEFVKASGTGFLHFRFIDDEKSLVCYSRLLDHWNAVAAVSKIEVLQKPRRFPLIFSSTLWRQWRAQRTVA